MLRQNSIRILPNKEEAYFYIVRCENIFIKGVGKNSLIKMFMKLY